MPSIGHDDSRVFSVDGFRDTEVNSRRSFSYLKLPQQQFKLSILKLDGSCFDVQVGGTASVAELKEAIEDSFNLSPKKGQCEISWSHVWGHFCLCFEGQKLDKDKAYIRSFGIKDGDQLCFIRHLSINYKPKKTSKSSKAYYEQKTTFSSGLDSLEEEEQRHEDDEDFDGCYGDKKRMDVYFRVEDGKNQDIVCPAEFKLAHFLRGWLSFSRLMGKGKPRPHSKARPQGLHRLRVGTKMTML